MAQFKFDDDDNDVFVMSMYTQDTTGLNQLVWMSRFNYTQRHFDHPYLIVSNTGAKHSFDNNFVVSVNKNPEIIQGDSVYSNEENQKIFEWIKLNYSLLWEHWIDDFSDDFEYIDWRLQKV